MMEILLLLTLPLVLALTSWFIRNMKISSVINVTGHGILLLTAVRLAWQLSISGAPFQWRDLIYADAVSGVILITMAFVNFASALASAGEIQKDVLDQKIAPRKGRTYHLLFNVFSFTMYLVTVVGNLGLLWVAIEVTTLVSAFLVGFANTKNSVEAAWKYLIICSAGISLALFGVILMFHAAGTLDISKLMILSSASPKIMKIAFLFLLVGFGTKAGLVPMHTWLPDAHSQAPAPVSALLSGVLIKTAVYAIIRCSITVNNCVGPEFVSRLLILFGLLSIGIAAAFIIIQKDMKRLLAYSSVEHMGIIILGFGFGGVAGITGALLHIFNHGLTKAMMFITAGRVVKRYRTNELKSITGVIRTMPVTGTILVVGAMALGGAVPFSIFISEFMIFKAGFQGGHYAASIFAFIMIVVVFAGLVHHFGKTVFGKVPAQMPDQSSPVSSVVAIVILFCIIFLFGIWVAPPFMTIVNAATAIIGGNV